MTIFTNSWNRFRETCLWRYVVKIRPRIIRIWVRLRQREENMANIFWKRTFLCDWSNKVPSPCVQSVKQYSTRNLGVRKTDRCAQFPAALEISIGKNESVGNGANNTGEARMKKLRSGCAFEINESPAERWNKEANYCACSPCARRRQPRGGAATVSRVELIKLNALSPQAIYREYL